MRKGESASIINFMQVLLLICRFQTGRAVAIPEPLQISQLGWVSTIIGTRND